MLANLKHSNGQSLLFVQRAPPTHWSGRSPCQMRLSDSSPESPCIQICRTFADTAHSLVKKSSLSDAVVPNREAVNEYVLYQLLEGDETTLFDTFDYSEMSFSGGRPVLIYGLCQSGKSREISKATWLTSFKSGPPSCVFLRNSIEGLHQFRRSIDGLSAGIEGMSRTLVEKSDGRIWQ